MDNKLNFNHLFLRANSKRIKKILGRHFHYFNTITSNEIEIYLQRNKIKPAVMAEARKKNKVINLKNDKVTLTISPSEQLFIHADEVIYNGTTNCNKKKCTILKGKSELNFQEECFEAKGKTTDKNSIELSSSTEIDSEISTNEDETNLSSFYQSPSNTKYAHPLGKTKHGNTTLFSIAPTISAAIQEPSLIVSNVVPIRNNEKNISSETSSDESQQSSIDTSISSSITGTPSISSDSFKIETISSPISSQFESTESKSSNQPGYYNSISEDTDITDSSTISIETTNNDPKYYDIKYKRPDHQKHKSTKSSQSESHESETASTSSKIDSDESNPKSSNNSSSSSESESETYESENSKVIDGISSSITSSYTSSSSESDSKTHESENSKVLNGISSSITSSSTSSSSESESKTYESENSKFNNGISSSLTSSSTSSSSESESKTYESENSKFINGISSSLTSSSTSSSSEALLKSPEISLNESKSHNLTVIPVKHINSSESKSETSISIGSSSESESDESTPNSNKIIDSISISSESVFDDVSIKHPKSSKTSSSSSSVSKSNEIKPNSYENIIEIKSSSSESESDERNTKKPKTNNYSSSSSESTNSYKHKKISKESSVTSTELHSDEQNTEHSKFINLSSVPGMSKSDELKSKSDKNRSSTSSETSSETSSASAESYTELTKDKDLSKVSESHASSETSANNEMTSSSLEDEITHKLETMNPSNFPLKIPTENPYAAFPPLNDDKFQIILNTSDIEIDCDEQLLEQICIPVGRQKSLHPEDHRLVEQNNKVYKCNGDILEKSDKQTSCELGVLIEIFQPCQKYAVHHNVVCLGKNSILLCDDSLNCVCQGGLDSMMIHVDRHRKLCEQIWNPDRKICGLKKI